MLTATNTTRIESHFGPRFGPVPQWAVDVGLALLTGFGMALAKRTLDFSLGIPGHAGTFWIAVLIAGSMGNRRRGMATLAGASVAVWAVPLGLHH